jgi:hypothetical protein
MYLCDPERLWPYGPRTTIGVSMAHQFERFVYWLNQGQNAAAVQAIAALATTFLTIVLLWATIRYVRLTSSLTRATHAQLEAALRPNLRFDLTRTLDAETGIKITNVGQIPVRLESVGVRAELTNEDSSITKALPDITGTLLMAGDDVFGTVSFEDHPKRIQVFDANVRSLLLVDCTDLGGITQHSFHYDPVTGLAKYFAGFRTRPPATYAFRDRIKHAGEVLRRVNR